MRAFIREHQFLVGFQFGICMQFVAWFLNGGDPMKNLSGWWRLIAGVI